MSPEDTALKEQVEMHNHAPCPGQQAPHGDPGAVQGITCVRKSWHDTQDSF